MKQQEEKKNIKSPIDLAKTDFSVYLNDLLKELVADTSFEVPYIVIFPDDVLAPKKLKSLFTYENATYLL